MKKGPLRYWREYYLAKSIEKHIGEINIGDLNKIANRQSLLLTNISSYMVYVSTTATVVNFEQSTYSVYEDSGHVELVLVLSNPSSTDLIVGVKIFNQETSSTSMYSKFKL